MVVESPAKAAKIQKFLGPSYKVLASYGHVRDLPPRGGSVRPAEAFAMDWQLLPRAAERVRALQVCVFWGGAFGVGGRACEGPQRRRWACQVAAAMPYTPRRLV